MNIQDLAKKIRTTPEFADFREYLSMQIYELNSVSDLLPLTNEKAGELAKVRLLAIQKLEQILQPFIEFSEKREFTDEEIAAAKARRGL